jgi:hypothetical protein
MGCKSVAELFEPSGHTDERADVAAAHEDLGAGGAVIDAILRTLPSSGILHTSIYKMSHV